MKQEAETLLSNFGLSEQGWTFKFANTKKAIGRCYYRERTIEFSKHYIDSAPEHITDTLLHEVAHALVGPGHGHDGTWRRQAMLLGASPKSCAESDVGLVNSAKPNYELVCPRCGREWHRYRLRYNSAQCPDCKIELDIYDLRST